MLIERLSKAVLTICIVRLSFFSGSVCALSLEAYSSLNGFSEPVPIQQMIHGWEQIGIGETVQAKIRFGSRLFVRRTYEIGVERRMDYYLKFSRATAQFYSLLERQALNEGEYPLHLSVNALSSLGVYIGLSRQWASYHINIRAYLLEGEAIQLGELRGVGEVQSDGDYSFEYDIDYKYSKDEILSQTYSPQAGMGYSFDLDVFTKLSPNLELNLGAEDLLHTMNWKNVPSSVGCIYRNRLIFSQCEDNSVQDSDVTVAQSLPNEVYLALKWTPVKRAYIQGKLRSWNNIQYFVLSGGYRQLQVDYDLLQNIAGFAFNSHFVSIKAAMDSWPIDEAYHWQSSVNLTWSF